MALKNVALGVMLAVPSLSFALGLGDIEVLSMLNQPLRAEIKLLYGDASEPESTEVQLASEADFARVGMNRDVLPPNINFEITRNDAGEFVILVTTRGAVVDPFVDFLIDVNWSNGRLLREYIVLLDPPVTVPSAGPAQVTPLAEPDQPTVTDVDFYQPPPEVSTPVPTGYPSGQNNYGPVEGGETLWVIARDWRPDPDISINQMMVMLLQLNPDAFFQDNINALKEGAILRLPEFSDFDTLSVSSATSSVRNQNQLWDDYRMAAAQRAPTVSDATAGAEYDYADSSPDTSYDDSRLELLPSAGDTQSLYGDAGGSPALQAELADVRLELQRTREDLVSAGQENTELSSRVGDLENLVSNLERAVALKDADLADLQDALDQARDQVYADNTGYDSGFQDSGEDTTEFADSYDSGFDDPNSGFDDGADDNAAQIELPEQADSTPVEVDTSVTPAVVDTTPVREPEAEGLLGMLTSPMALVSLGVLLFGGAGFVFWRRRRFAAEAGASLIDSFADDGDDDELAQTSMMKTSLMRLMDNLEDNPSDPQNHLALLRSYYASADRAAFVKAARKLLEHIGGEDHPAWKEVRTMGANLAPDDELFAVVEASEPAAEDPPSLAIRSVTADDSSDSEDITDLDLDFTEDEPPAGDDDDMTDLDLDFSANESAETEAEDDDGEDELSLDFDLDTDEAEPTASASPEDSKDQDMAMDFDLDDDDDGEEGEDALSLDFDLDTDQSKDDAKSSDDDNVMDFDLDDLDGSEEAPDSKAEPSGDAPTEFDIEAISTEEAAEDATDDLDLTLDNIDDPAAAEDDSDTETHEKAAMGDDDDDDALDGLGLDDLDLGDTSLIDEEDATGTKLELAKAYVSMGDPDGARGMLEEVIAEGSEEQKAEAQKLIDDL